jgi:hypothetical protein
MAVHDGPTRRHRIDRRHLESALLHRAAGPAQERLVVVEDQQRPVHPEVVAGQRHHLARSP